MSPARKKSGQEAPAAGSLARPLRGGFGQMKHTRRSGKY